MARMGRRLLVGAVAAAVLTAGCASRGPAPPPGTAAPEATSTTESTPPGSAESTVAPSTVAPSTVAVTTGPPSPPTTRPTPPHPLVDVSTIEPSVVVALNKLTSDNFTGTPLPGYEANRAFLLPGPAGALAAVQRRLAARGLGLKVYDAYRPRRATRAMVEWVRRQGRGDLVGPYIAEVSYHNSGQAVDLTLVERVSGQELDMGAPYETFTPAAHTANATGEAARNRAVLVEAMEAEGFSNYEGEWWHFNYFVDGATPLDEVIR